MLGLVMVPAAALPQSQGNAAPVPETDGSGGGFADLLGSPLAPSASATPTADAEATGAGDAAGERDLQGHDSHDAEHAVAGMWLARDWAQRLDQPGLAEPAADAEATGAGDAIGESDPQERDPQERDPHDAEHAVAGMWLARDWAQRPDEPRLAQPVGETREAGLRRTTHGHGMGSHGDAPLRTADGAETGQPAPDTALDRKNTAPPAQAVAAQPTDHDPFALASESTATADTATSPAPPPSPSLPLQIGGTSGPGATGAHAAGIAAAVHIGTPAGDAQFPSALAARLSMLVRDGVQQAKLHLHPAEMGPVAVQIAMEGTRAHINFVAAVDSTCQLLEDSLGQLGSALNEAGLSLAGSDVFHQSADPRRQQVADHADARSAAAAPRADSSTLPGAGPLRPRGMIDLVA